MTITSDVVERALADAEKLIASQSAVSGVDRVHTAFHGYLREVCGRAEIEVEADATITQLFKQVRSEHPGMQRRGPRATDVEKVAKALAAILDALSPLRNRASVAHANTDLLGDAEAMLVVNAVRTLLHYIDARLRDYGDGDGSG